jgi:hypothetical protein
VGCANSIALSMGRSRGEERPSSRPRGQAAGSPRGLHWHRFTVVIGRIHDLSDSSKTASQSVKATANPEGLRAANGQQTSGIGLTQPAKGRS